MYLRADIEEVDCMTTWVTSDTHFSHVNIIKFEPAARPFNSIEEMNEILIKNWNDKVMPEDTIIHCGDFFMGKLEEIDKILPRLNGKIILVKGNHDTPARIEKFKEYGVEVHDIYYITYKGVFFICCHFPFDSKDFIEMVRGDNPEVVFLYGHIHSNAPPHYSNGTYHVGVDTNNLAPVKLKDIWAMNRCAF